MIKIKLDLEKIALIVFFTIFLFIGPGSLFNHEIQHEFPYSYLASDTFQHQVRAESIKDAGNFRYEAPYISQGFEDVVGRYPPIIYHLSVIFAYLAGLEVYDAIYFLVFFFGIIAVLVMYLIIRNFNKNIALISLPLTILVLSHPLSIGFTWGHWPSLVSQFFLIVFFWCIMMINLDKSYVLIALIFTSIALTHTSEAIFGLIFLALFFIIKLISKNLNKIDIKNVFIAFAIAFVISLHYLIIFRYTWARTETYSFMIEPTWKGNPGFYILDFGILTIFILTGIIFALFKLKNMHTSLVLAFAMLIGGHLNYIGFGLRSFQTRFFWPIYLSVFFGFGVYMLLKFIVRKWNIAYSLAIFVVLTGLLTGLIKIPLIPQYSKLTSQGLMDIYHWSALQWLSKDTDLNSKIYFFYGDIYSQDALLRNSKRVHYQVDPDDFVKALQDKKIKRYYISELPGDSGGSISIRTGLFGFDDVAKGKPPEYFFGIQDICKFDYLIFDKVSRQQVFAQYNLFIASELIKKQYISNVFENEVVVILKNSNVGADCIEERNF